MNERVQKRLVARRLRELEGEVRWRRALLVFLVGLAIVGPKALESLDWFGRVAIGFLPFLLIGGVVFFLGIAVVVEVVQALRAWAWQGQEALREYWNVLNEPANWRKH